MNTNKKVKGTFQDLSKETFRISHEFVKRDQRTKSKAFKLDTGDGKFKEVVMYMDNLDGKNVNVRNKSDYSIQGSSNESPPFKIVKVDYNFDNESFETSSSWIPNKDRAKSFVVTAEIRLPSKKVETEFEPHGKEINQLVLKQFEQADATKVSITCGKESYPINKLMLMSRSSVFKLILNNSKSKEAQTNKIKFNKHGSDITRLFCQFLNEFELDEDELNTHAVDLFSLGMMYELEPLTRFCTKPICRIINIENFVGIVELGYLHNNAEILTAALHFFLNNKREVKSLEAWNKLIETCPDMPLKMMEAESWK